MGKDNTVNFNQPSGDSATLNRVTGDFTSEIAGRINANGSVFLVNPNGIMVTKDGVIDTGGFVASTLDIDNDDFLNGDYAFTKSGANGVVSNRGHISVDDGGFVALLGGAVKNNGTVRALVGKVGFAGGEKIVMSFGNNDFLRVEVPTDTWDKLTDSQGNKVAATIDLGGKVDSRGGFVDITIADASDILRQTISIDGIVSANTVSSTDGFISISGGTVGITGNGRITADADYGTAGTIAIKADSIDSSGTVSAVAQNGSGGTVKVSLQHGANLNASTRFDVSGKTKGGSLSFIGGLDKIGTKVLGSADFKADSTDGTGGTIDISNKGGLVGLLSGTVSAAGKTRGGRIRLGGAFQGGGYDPKTSALDTKTQDLFVNRWGGNSSLVSAGKTSLGTGVTVIVSSALGTGGTAIVWADHTTNNYAAIDATGATGGGAVEISGKKQVDSFGLGRVKANNGVILLDPKNVVISKFSGGLAQAKKIAHGVSLSGSSVSLDDYDSFGRNVSLSGDGTKLAVGATGDDDGGRARGAVYLFIVGGSSWGSTVTQAVKLSDSHSSVYLNNKDYFGSSVSLSGDGTKLAVGAPYDDDGGSDRGAVYLYTVGGSSWGKPVTQAVKLSNNHASVSLDDKDYFGSGVSLSGDGTKLAVGAWGDDDGGSDQNANRGAVYLYTVGGSSWGRMVTQAVKLSDSHASISLDDKDYFGSGVSLSGDGTKLAVGARGDDDGGSDQNANRGAVYLYTVGGSGATWGNKVTQAVKLSGSHASVSLDDNDKFGYSVSLSVDGTKLAVGATGDDGGGTDRGAVYLYTVGGSGATWGSTVKQAVKLSDSHASISLDNYDRFGISVSLSGDGTKLAVGAWGDDDGGSDQNANRGAVYLYTVGGSSWGKTVTQAVKLSGSHAGVSLDDYDRFGISVSLSGDGTKLAVGAPDDDDGGSARGAVYLYTVGGSSWGSTVTQAVKLSDSHASVSLDNSDYFGSGVSLSGDGTKLAVGAYLDDDGGSARGAVYLYTVGGSSWGKTVKQAVKLSDSHASVSLDNSDYFGSGVSLSSDGTKLAVGAPDDDDGGSNRGAVYLYTVDGSSWGKTVKQAVKLSDSHASVSLDNYDNFGSGVSLSGDGTKLAVGAPYDDDGGVARGAVYLYTVGGSSWGKTVTQAVKLSDSHASVSLDDDDRFGRSVSLSGDGTKLAVGARGDDDGGTDRGAVYLYTVGGSGATWGSTVKQAVKLSDSHASVSLDDKDYFGESVSLSGDGTKLAVGAEQDDDGGSNRGAVYLYTVGGSSWGKTVMQAVKLSDAFSSDGDYFGSGVSLSSDGTKLAVGARGDDDGGRARGAVYLYTVGGSGATWGSTVTQAVKLSDRPAGVSLGNYDLFGSSVSLSGDGTKLAVGATGDNDGGSNRGAVYLYTVGGSSWGKTVKQAVKLSDSHASVSLDNYDYFGIGVSLSGDGTKLAVGALYDDDGGSNRGAVYLYTVGGSGATWGSTVKQAVKLSDSHAGVPEEDSPASVSLDDEDYFGIGVSLSGDGTKLAVGAYGDDDGAYGSGAVYLYTVGGSGATWGSTVKQAVKLSDGHASVSLDYDDGFGRSVSLSGDGTKLAVGAAQDDDGGSNRGAVYLYTVGGSSWGKTVTQAVKLSDSHASISLDDRDNFGSSVSLSGDGTKLAVGAPGDNDGADGSGAVYLYTVPGGNLAGIKQKLEADNTGVTVVASNDITIQDDLDTLRDSVGGTGKLTLIAGRSVIINADVKIKGGLVIKANDASDSGFVLNDRNTGKAEITVAANKTISGGDDDLIIKMLTGKIGGAANKKQTGKIIVWKADGKRVSIIHNGSTTTGATPSDSEIVILSGGEIKATGDYNTGNVVIELKADKFTNQSGSSALNVADSGSGNGNTAGRYLVWTATPKDNTMGGINGYGFVTFNETYSGNTDFKANTAVGSDGDTSHTNTTTKHGFIYSANPTLAITATGNTKVYDGTSAHPTNASFDFKTQNGGVSGLKFKIGQFSTNPTNVQSNFKGTFTTNPTGKFYNGNVEQKNVGKNLTLKFAGRTITYVDGNNVPAYGLTPAPAIDDVTGASITPRPLTVSATPTNRVYNGSTSVAYTGAAISGWAASEGAGKGISDVFNGTLTATAASKDAGTRVVTLGGLTGLKTAYATNYKFDFTNAAADYDNTKSITITKKTLKVGATYANRVYNGSTDVVNQATVTISGWAASEGAGKGISDVFNGTLTATAANKDVGTRVVTLGGLTGLKTAYATNYKFDFTNAAADYDNTKSITITKKTLKVGATYANRVYNGSTDVVNQATVTISGWAASEGAGKGISDVFNGTLTATAANKDVGTRVVTLGGLTGLKTAYATNYKFDFTNAAADYDNTKSITITKKTLKVGATYANRVYNGSTDVVNQATVTISGWAASEGAGKGISDVFNGTLTATAANKDVGTRVVTLGGLTGLKTAYATNYKFDFTNAAADYDNTKSITITKKTLKVGATYANRVYNGSTDVVNQATVTISGWAASEGAGKGISDVFNGTLTATAANKDVGTRVVTLGGLTGLKTAYATNYKFDFTNAAADYDNTKSITITKKTLKVGATYANRVYNGSTDVVNQATVTISGWAASEGAGKGISDVFNGTLTATAANKDVGTRVVTLGGLTGLKTAYATNYKFDFTNAAADYDNTKSITITKKTLKVGATYANRVYNGSTDVVNQATVTISGWAASEGAGKGISDVFNGTLTATAANKDVGTRVVTLGGLTGLKTAYATNYKFDFTNAAADYDNTKSITITKKTLKVGATYANRVYNGSTDVVNQATVTISGWAASEGAGKGISDVFNGTLTATAANKDVGTRVVTLGGLTGLKTAYATNYKFDFTNAAADYDNTKSITITKKTLKVGATYANRVYNGSTDVVNQATVTISGWAASEGAGKGISDVFNGTLTATAANKDVGTRVVTLGGLTGLKTAYATNYKFDFTNAAADYDNTKSITITKKTLKVGATYANRVYNGSTDVVNQATVTISGWAASEGAGKGISDVFNGTLTATAANKDVGTRVVTLGGLTGLKTAYATNYKFDFTNAAADYDNTKSITITKKTLKVGATYANRVYNGSTDVVNQATVTISGWAASEGAGKGISDVFNGTLTATAANKDVGTRVVTLGGLTGLKTAYATNYKFDFTNAAADYDNTKSITITKKTLKVGATYANRVYNGSTDVVNQATVTISGWAASEGAGKGISDVFNGTLTATAANKDVGTRVVTLGGLTGLKTAYATNYKFDFTNAAADYDNTKSITITKKTLKVGATYANRVYNGSTDVVNQATVTISGWAASEGAGKGISDVFNGTLTATAANKDVGTRVVTLGGLTGLKTAYATNYKFDFTNAAADYDNTKSITITKKTLKVGATYANRVYNGSTDVVNQATVTISGWAASEGAGKGISDVFNGTLTATAANKDVGTRVVTLGGLTGLKTAYATNYKFDFTNAAADYDNTKSITITKKTLKVGATYANRVYNGSTDVVNQATVTISGWAASEGAGKGISDVFNGTLTATAANKDVGTRVVTLGGLTGLKTAYATNYKFDFTNAAADYDNTKSITITKKTLTVSATPTNRVYNGLTSVAFTGAAITGWVGNEGNSAAGISNAATGNLSATAASKDVGTRAVTFGGLTLKTSGKYANYTLVPDTTKTVVISQKTLTVSATPTNRVYNGLTSVAYTGAAITGWAGNEGSSGAGISDAATGTLTATAASKDVGTRAVIFGGLTLKTSGKYTNYTLAYDNMKTVDITPVILQLETGELAVRERQFESGNKIAPVYIKSDPQGNLLKGYSGTVVSGETVTLTITDGAFVYDGNDGDQVGSSKSIIIGDLDKLTLSSQNYKLQYNNADLDSGVIGGLTGTILQATAGGGGGAAIAVVAVGAGVAVVAGGIGGAAAAGAAAGAAGAAGAGAGAAGAGAGGASGGLIAPIGSIDNIFTTGIYAHLSGIDMQALYQPTQTPVPSVFKTQNTYKTKYTTSYDMALLANNIKAQKAVPLYELDEHLYETLKNIFVQQSTPMDKTARTDTKDNDPA